MRLLKTDTLEFEEFQDNRFLGYAILSHVWVKNDEERGEVSFQDFAAAKQHKNPDLMKIRRFCSLALESGLPYAWIDTCCINKESSSELSEAINSMYDWYRCAIECYVYMEDVIWDEHNLQESKAQFQQSEWFTRGWTLQELLAPEPECTIFFDQRWRRIGSTHELAKEIHQTTGIGERYLGAPEKASAAMKMSWASNRRTTKGEDVAYSLLGLFDVNMPLLYGEGKEKAFLRLQLEIIKKSDDESIFAWTSPKIEDCSMNLDTGGMLALRPSWFADSKDIFLKSSKEDARMPYAMTNKGLQFNIPLRHGRSYESQMYGEKRSNATVPLNCWRKVRIEARQGNVTESEEENEALDERQKDSGIEDDSGDSGEETSKTKEKVIAIRLKRKGGIWQRINCHGPFELRKRLPESFKQGSRTIEHRTAMIFVRQDEPYWLEKALE